MIFILYPSYRAKQPLKIPAFSRLLFFSILRAPLEWREGLWNEKACGYHHSQPSETAVHFAVNLGAAFRQSSYPRNILIGLSRKPQHEIQLYRRISRSECPAHRALEILRRNIFIYYIPQPLRARLRRKCKAAAPHLVRYKIRVKGIKTKRGKAGGNMSALKILRQSRRKLLYMAVITRGKRR